ncbi:polysaccharide deacetylase family protein [Pontibacter sp. CAU 1760]
MLAFYRYLQLLSICGTLLIASCQESTVEQAETPDSSTIATSPAIDSTLTVDASAATELPSLEEASAETILSRPQVPILCYHQIRDWRSTDSRQAKDYIVPEARFREQIKLLADSGYHTVLPDQLRAYLTHGAPLPAKPIMLTFDDTNLDQYTVAAPELEKHGFKGVFFVMTVAIGKPRYMSREQLKELSDRGHAIGSHTWDHQNVKKISGEQWHTQVEKPKQVLEEITGKPVTYFAYPFGLWNKEVIPELKSRGMEAAFQLSTNQDDEEPLYTIRRHIASGYWDAPTLHKRMVASFKLQPSHTPSTQLVQQRSQKQ